MASRTKGKARTKAERALDRVARVAVSDCLALREGEKVVIVTNPLEDVQAISHALYRQAEARGASPTLILQPAKGQLEFAEEPVLAALRSEPEVVVSISFEKLGKDPAALAKPIRVKKRGKRSYRRYNHVFEYLLEERRSRSFWSPGVTIDMFTRTVPIDYALLQQRCDRLGSAISRAEEVLITSPSGTDAIIGVRGRRCRKDDGRFNRPGTGGNLPCGEVFASPELGASDGRLVFDASISSDQGVILIDRPIECRLEGGFVTRVSGGKEANALKKTLRRSKEAAKAMGDAGDMPAKRAEELGRNARNLGELGIGLNPAARVVGNMLEDEKAFRTCHMALGANYDMDAPALTHLDGLMSDPTIQVVYKSGRRRVLLRDGELV
jgi:leucyl aminopeptidase (aminopeptidase T)